MAMIDPRIPIIQEGEAPLKAIREKLNMTQEQFAQTIGVGPVSVSRWENGASVPRLTIAQVKKLSALIQQLGITIDNLPDNIGPPEEST